MMNWIIGADGSYMCPKCNKAFRYEIGNYCSNCGERLIYTEDETIYVVTQGVYSGYHIITATTDILVAESVKNRFSDEYNEVRIEKFNNSATMLKPLWFVKFTGSGQVYRCWECTDSYDYANELNVCSYDGIGMVYTYVTACTREDAIKIAAEKRAQFLALENGL